MLAHILPCNLELQIIPLLVASAHMFLWALARFVGRQR